MVILDIYWEDQDISTDIKAEIYISLIESREGNCNENIDLEEVKDILSGLDERQSSFGDVPEIQREIRVFEINEKPFCTEDNIYVVQDAHYAVKKTQRNFDYLVVDNGRKAQAKFLTVTEVIACVQYNP